MKDYSQNGEQKIFFDYFNKTSPKHTFRALDIGANDGETFSMTRGLMTGGFLEGLICVEPSPAAFEKLDALYEGDTSVFKIQAAITTRDGPIDLYDSGTHLKKGDVALLSTTVPSEMDRWKKSGETFTKTTVRGITFETLMKETGVNRFEMISIDAEGADVPILLQIDLTAVGCQLLCIEFNQRKDNEVSIDIHCRKHGMKLIHRNFENLIYAK